MFLFFAAGALSFHPHNVEWQKRALSSFAYGKLTVPESTRRASSPVQFGADNHPMLNLRWLASAMPGAVVGKETDSGAEAIQAGQFHLQRPGTDPGDEKADAKAAGAGEEREPLDTHTGPWNRFPDTWSGVYDADSVVGKEGWLWSQNVEESEEAKRYGEEGVSGDTLGPELDVLFGVNSWRVRVEFARWWAELMATYAPYMQYLKVGEYEITADHLINSEVRPWVNTASNDKTNSSKSRSTLEVPLVAPEQSVKLGEKMPLLKPEFKEEQFLAEAPAASRELLTAFVARTMIWRQFMEETVPPLYRRNPLMGGRRPHALAQRGVKYSEYEVKKDPLFEIRQSTKLRLFNDLIANYRSSNPFTSTSTLPPNSFLANSQFQHKYHYIAPLPTTVDLPSADSSIVNGMEEQLNPLPLNLASVAAELSGVKEATTPPAQYDYTFLPRMRPDLYGEQGKQVSRDVSFSVVPGLVMWCVADEAIGVVSILSQGWRAPNAFWQ